jgi:DNA-binding transcriptional regulator YiaG
MSSYHYTECGLHNVRIHNMELVTDDSGESVITIPAVNELHWLIAQAIVSHAKGMSGEELRFLRTEMGLTQAELAACVDRDKQSVGRWERGELRLDRAAETIVRRLAVEKLELSLSTGIDELARRSEPVDVIQPINITVANDNGSGFAHYELMAA